MMQLAQVWRYPVKSMAGERLVQTALMPLGIEGDRVIHLEDAHGQVITSRSHPRLLTHQATLGHAGEVLIDGTPWDAPSLHLLAEEIAGPGARFVRDESENRFDILPLLVATDGAITAFGHDGRRLRPNLIIGGVDGMAERTWEGKQLRIGEAVIQIHDLRGRCVMTTYDPDTQARGVPAQNMDILRDIVKKFGGKLALNCSVLRGGAIREGDAAQLL